MAVDKVFGTEVRPCSCISSDQDRIYGAGKRLHNRGKGGSRCTVCGDGKGIQSKKATKGSK